MMKHQVALLLLLSGLGLQAQNSLYIPPVLTGASIDLTVDEGTHEFYPGMPAPTIGYNGGLLGPTLFLGAGSQVQFTVQNDLADTTTVHWHGLHVAPQNDGGPHSAILPGGTWSPSFTIMDKAGTYWYHPHPHGKTMEQVLKGAAGMIIVGDAEEAMLPLPRTYGVDDIPLVLQFKGIDAQGQLIMNDEVDNEVLVNGSILPDAELPAQVVRLRLLNGSSMRTFRLGTTAGVPMQMIASDAGLLDAPLSLNRLDLSPGERAEVLLDLSGMNGTSFQLMSYGNELPQGVMGGPPGMMLPAAPVDNTTLTLLNVNVIAPTPDAVTVIPPQLTTNVAWDEADANQTINLSLMSLPMMGNNWFINSLKYDMMRIDETVQLGSTVVWNISNNSMMAHPIHIHGGHFYILEKDGAPPPPQEAGRKDVVLVEAMRTAKVIMKYEDFSDPVVPYMYHCHILSHEDDGMMGQFLVEDGTNGMSELEEGGLVVFPNPVEAGELTIASQAGSIRFVRILDPLGKVVRERNPNAAGPVQLDLEGFSPGPYLVQITGADGGQVARPILIQ